MLLILPEVLICTTLVLSLLLAAFRPEGSLRASAGLCAVGLGLALLALLNLPAEGSLFGGAFHLDSVTLWFKGILLVSALLVVLLAADSPRSEHEGHASGEYFATLLGSLLGMLFLVSAGDLLTLFIGLELATLPLVLLSAWNRQSESSAEAALKYVLLAALSSGLIVFGLALVAGLHGSLSFEAGITALSQPIGWLGFALLLSGGAFKMSLAPFHLWAADVYEGAPTPVTTWLSMGSKAAGLAFLVQLVYRVFPEALWDISPLLAGLAAITMTVGNLVAIVQQNLKRFMAYSSISQAGYLLFGFLDPSGTMGIGAMLYYLLVYLAGNVAVFGVILYWERAAGAREVEDFRGFSRERPGLAVALLLGLLSLAGIPPLAGFTGKFLLFSVAADAGYHWLVLLGAINSTISLYYYLRILRQAYIEDPEPATRRSSGGGSTAFVIAFGGVTVLLAGVVPAVYELIHQSTMGWLAGF
ncbi:MAG: NADH-quinone oxidoreductase subunit N [Candidatus Cloacimonetes bacterium]|nr:NADH-quinone oxidoreductase subunit N [Candidatus Cloacimonadota bacterium]